MNYAPEVRTPMRYVKSHLDYCVIDSLGDFLYTHFSGVRERTRFAMSGIQIWLQRASDAFASLGLAIKDAGANVLGSGQLLPISTMIITFLIGWLVTRFTLFPTETPIDWKAMIQRTAFAEEPTTNGEQKNTKPDGLSAAASNDKYMLFLVSNIGTLKVVLAWVCVLLIIVAVWRLLHLLILAGILSSESISSIQSSVVDPALSFVYDSRVYTSAFTCIIASMVVNLFLVLFVFNPSKQPKGGKNAEETKSDSRIFLNLSLGTTALVFLIGFAFTFAFASDSDEIHSMSSADGSNVG